MKRGELVIVSLPGDYGKPRPALIIQSDLFSESPSRTLLPLTTDASEAPLVRIRVDPSPENGLRRRSYIMADKTYTMPCAKIGPVCGQLDNRTMLKANRALAVFLGFA
jgi:mRNA interferase MazF